jgi:2-polyprenyl-6-methoxyphenol hydroxylase-like FAD-dependent oxidoreductase
MVRLAPKGSVIHWPLTWRNLRRNWTSKGGRVVQLGDAAHATVPSSASGATLALEDAITLVSCLQLSSSAAGGAGAPLGARIFNLLQYQRASCIQKMSFVNAQLMNSKTANWDAIKADSKKVRIRFAKWVFRHDPEAYVYEKYGPAFAHIVTGADFTNTNIPPGHKFVPWTIDEIERDIADGKRIEDLLDGDWT